MITLDNGLVRVVVEPERGGRVRELTDLSRGVQWIWRSPRATGAPVAPGANYDDHWEGGWEELFPNDAPGSFDGFALEDHGLWWSRPWSSTRDALSATMTLECESPRASCRKTVALRPGAREVAVSYSIVNRETRPLRFLFKQHLAVAVTPDHELLLPGGEVRAVEPGFGTRFAGRDARPWPTDAGLDTCPPAEQGHRDFVSVSGSPEGWCGVRHAPTGAVLRLEYPAAAFPFVWLFMTYGGWRDLYTVVLEPCTNFPKDLAAAAAAGNCAALPPGGSFECEVKAVLS